MLPTRQICLFQFATFFFFFPWKIKTDRFKNHSMDRMEPNNNDDNDNDNDDNTYILCHHFVWQFTCAYEFLADVWSWNEKSTRSKLDYVKHFQDCLYFLHIFGLNGSLSIRKLQSMTLVIQTKVRNLLFLLFFPLHLKSSIHIVSGFFFGIVTLHFDFNSKCNGKKKMRKSTKMCAEEEMWNDSNSMHKKKTQTNTGFNTCTWLWI